ncbi:MAG: NfeD family protein [Fimbriimonadales bacterium]|nr:NfeD family protein [Fimbriimonadales bacterium]
MLPAYVMTAVIGGVLIIVSLFGGEHDHSLDHDSDLSVDKEFDTWLPFFSLRFWTYLCLGFGLTGLLLTLFTDLAAPMTAGISGGVGLLCGLAIAYTMRWLRVSETNSSASEADLIGAEAKVLVQLRPESPGKIRANIKGELIDLVALADEKDSIGVGEQVMIVSIDGDRAKVVRRSMFFGEE